MPIYEYRCQKCGRVSEYLLLRMAEDFAPLCRRCGSGAMERVLSRVRVRLSEETRLERLADPGRWGDLKEDDPRSAATMLKKLAQEFGEDLAGDVDVDEMMEEALADEAAATGLPDENLE